MVFCTRSLLRNYSLWLRDPAELLADSRFGVAWQQLDSAPTSGQKVKVAHSPRYAHVLRVVITGPNGVRWEGGDNKPVSPVCRGVRVGAPRCMCSQTRLGLEVTARR